MASPKMHAALTDLNRGAGRVMMEPQNDALTPEQQDTANLLERVLGRAIADRYVDFCRLASGAFDLRVSRHVAAHALRELDSMLRDALAVPMEVKALESLIDPELLVRAKAALEGLGIEVAAAEKAEALIGLGAKRPQGYPIRKRGRLF